MCEKRSQCLNSVRTATGTLEIPVLVSSLDSEVCKESNFPDYLDPVYLSYKNAVICA